jgi:hypothetical protein
VSATDVVVGRLTRRIREARSAPGAWLDALTHEVRWLPGRLPGSGPLDPVHDGYYEVRRGGDMYSFAYPSAAAGYIVLQRMTVTLPLGLTIDDALEETEAWAYEPS